MNSTTKTDQRFITAAAWIIMLAVSILPNAIWHEITGGGSTRWLYWVKMTLLVVLILAMLAWKKLRPLLHFVLIITGVYAFEEISSWLTGSALWKGWFGGTAIPFSREMLGIQLGRLLVSLLVIGLLLVMGYRRRQFFLVQGKPDAPIEPVRWLGFTKPIPWTKFGGQFAVYISLGLLVFLIIGGRPSAASFIAAAPMLPMILLLAAMNAFNEEMTYRSSMLATLEPAIGSRQALWNAAVFFGIGHYFGVPYGIVGVIMSTFLGWLLGKAMLETRGFFWAWFIHFLQDVLIFSFMAAGSITPGG